MRRTFASQLRRRQRADHAQAFFEIAGTALRGVGENQCPDAFRIGAIKLLGDDSTEDSAHGSDAASADLGKRTKQLLIEIFFPNNAVTGTTGFRVQLLGDLNESLRIGLKR